MFFSQKYTHILFIRATHEIPLCNLEYLTFLHTHGCMDGWLALNPHSKCGQDGIYLFNF